MQYIKMKVVAFDESSYSLLCSFASDETQSHDPADYPAYAYQPMNMWPDIDDPTIIKERIALTGVGIVDNQAREEKFIADPAKIAQYKAMVGSVVEYPIDELIPPAPENTIVQEMTTIGS
jgi:hypothetical protein